MSQTCDLLEHFFPIHFVTVGSQVLNCKKVARFGKPTDVGLARATTKHYALLILARQLIPKCGRAFFLFQMKPFEDTMRQHPFTHSQLGVA